jgi:two-component system, OmpR family, response regulator MtrA
MHAHAETSPAPLRSAVADRAVTATILIADNDDAVVLAIKTRLRSQGYHCLTAQTGAQALAIFRTERVDLIISDLNMPAGDGVSLASTVRQSSDIPIIFITGFRDGFRRSLRSVTNVTIVEKPFDSRTLLELVEASLPVDAQPTQTDDAANPD